MTMKNPLQKEPNLTARPNSRIVWLGSHPQIEIFTKSKKGNSWEMMKLSFHTKVNSFDIVLNEAEGKWLVSVLKLLSVNSENKTTFSQLKSSFESELEDFELFWFSKPMQTLRASGLLLL